MPQKSAKLFGIILAAGRGERMKARTESRPKCLTVLANKSLLEWQISALKTVGIHDLCIVRGYQKNTIFCQEYWFRDNPHWEHSSILRSLLCAQDILSFYESIICYSDIAFHPDHVRCLLAGVGDIRITYDVSWKRLWERRFESPLNDAESFIHDKGKLIRIGGKVDDITIVQGQYMGLTAITPKGWHRISGVLKYLSTKELNEMDMTALFSFLLDKGIDIEAIPVDGKWCEVDSEKDISIYEELLAAPKDDWEHDWRW